MEKETKSKVKVNRSKKEKIYYMNSYYIRYLIHLQGNNHKAIEDGQRALLEEQGESGQYVLLDRRLLTECCEDIKYEDELEAGENATPLPDMSENFVRAFCKYFQVEAEDICFTVDTECIKKGSKAGEINWMVKRVELREKRDWVVWESERLADILNTVLKLCDIGYLVKTAGYLADMLHPHIRHSWMEMEKLLEGLNLYLGYPEVLTIGRVETSRGWDYPVKDKFTFQKNEPLDREILASLIKRQGMKNREELAKELSTDGETVYEQRIAEIVAGSSGTSVKAKIAERMGDILHAGWKDMKGEGEPFWAEPGIALWEEAEKRMRQAVQSLKLKDWEGIMNGHAASEEIFLAVKNVLRFGLCCHKPERNRTLLEMLEDRVQVNAEESAADKLLCRCIQELKEETPLLTELKYKLLLNGMNVELRLREAFEGELGEAICRSAEEKIREFCRKEACADKKRKKLIKEEIRQLQERKRREIFRKFWNIWLPGTKKYVCPNPWFQDTKVTVTWLYYEEDEALPVLEDEIEVRIELPRELDKCLDPGEITAMLPYEKGESLDDVINHNWFKISEALDDCFGQELEGWDAELYDVWKDNVEFRSEKIHYRDWELYNVNNEALDRMIQDETYGNRYEFYAALGRQKLIEEGKKELAMDETECYEEGILMLRRAERERAKKEEKNSVSVNKAAEEI